MQAILTSNRATIEINWYDNLVNSLPRYQSVWGYIIDTVTAERLAKVPEGVELASVDFEYNPETKQVILQCTKE